MILNTFQEYILFTLKDNTSSISMVVKKYSECQSRKEKLEGTVYL